MTEHTGGCCSWWRGSRNTRRQASWLHTTLEEMHQKTQNMLDLLEDKSDSLSQRAEFFYLKRPQLISMIEDNYRAYRSLAEQFDRLKGQIRESSPESVQNLNGLSCEALENPLGKQNSVNENPNKCGKEFLRSEKVGDPVNCNPGIKRPSDQESVHITPSDQESRSASSFSDSELPSQFEKPTETGNFGSLMKEKQIEMEEETSLLLKQLTAKDIQVEHLKVKNNKKGEKDYCREKMSLVMQNRSQLQKEMEIIIVENTKLGNENENEVNVWEMNDLLRELYFTREENTKLRNENEINVQRLQVLRKKASNLQKENKSYKIMSLVLACVNENLQKEMCGANQESEGTVRFKTKEPHSESCHGNLKVDVIKAESTKPSNGNEVRAKKGEELRNENEINQQKLQAFTQTSPGSQHGKGEANVQVQVLSEKLKRLEKMNSNLSKRNKIMSLAYLNSQAARSDASNASNHYEICGANCPYRESDPVFQGEQKNSEITGESKKMCVLELNFNLEELQRQVFGLVTENAILNNDIEVNVQRLQVPKENTINFQWENTKISCTQNKNVEIILEEKEKLVIEQSLKIGALQSEVYQLLDENKVQEIQLLERNEKVREAVRQLCFTLDALMDKNKRLQKSLQKIREEEERKTKNIETRRPSQMSRWKRFLYGGRRIQGFSYSKARSFNRVAEEVM